MWRSLSDSRAALADEANFIPTLPVLIGSPLVHFWGFIEFDGPSICWPYNETLSEPPSSAHPHPTPDTLAVVLVLRSLLNTPSLSRNINRPPVGAPVFLFPILCITLTPSTSPCRGHRASVPTTLHGSCSASYLYCVPPDTFVIHVLLIGAAHILNQRRCAASSSLSSVISLVRIPCNFQSCAQQARLLLLCMANITPGTQN